MRSFREFIIENYNVPVVDIETTGTDVSIPEIKNELNRNIDLVLHQSFKTVEEALQKLRKILALYTLDVPQVDVNDKKSGTLKLIVGHHNISWDEFKGKLENSNPFVVKFKYALIDGLYKCSAELI